MGIFDKPNALKVLGLILLDGELHGIELSYKRGKPALERTYDFSVDLKKATEEHFNPLFMSDEGQALSKNLNNFLIVTSLSADEVLVRPLEIKLKKQRDIEAVLAFQAEPLLPYPVENAILDSLSLQQSAEGSRLIVLAARKDHIQKHIEQWHSLNIEPEVISCIPVGLAAFSKQFTETKNAHFVLHIGKHETIGILVQEGKLLASQKSDTGWHSLLDAFLRDNKDAQDSDFFQVDFLSIPESQFPNLSNAFEIWRRGVARLLFSLAKSSKDSDVNEILFAGDVAEFHNLEKALVQPLQKDILQPSVLPSFAIPISKVQKYAIPIGIALTALPKAAYQINFRQQEYAYPRPWRRLKAPLMTYAALCIALSLAIYFFALSSLNSKQYEIRQHYLELLVASNKSYESFEKEYEAKHPLARRPAEGILLPQDLTMDEIQDRTEVLQKELKETPNTFPLHPNIPRVADVLAWLSTHPKVVGKEGEAGPVLQIDNFSYTMVKRPEIKRPSERYQAKVEVEFSSQTPMQAREFHDALIAPNDLVDPKGEIKWNANKGKYKASFYLKDKTVYTGT